jgi:predicted patatin/cPLA2 family phospholipase
MADKKFGVAFSGGGIRSAAFCSGVLRRLITKKKEPDLLSCVSGGGYTGSAYMHNVAVNY